MAARLYDHEGTLGHVAVVVRAGCLHGIRARLQGFSSCRQLSGTSSTGSEHHEVNLHGGRLRGVDTMRAWSASMPCWYGTMSSWCMDHERMVGEHAGMVWNHELIV